MRILFLTLDIGFGHRRVAEAVEKALRRLTPGLESHSYNILDLLSPSLAEGLARFYLDLEKEDAALHTLISRRINELKRGLGRQGGKEELVAGMQKAAKMAGTYLRPSMKELRQGEFGLEKLLFYLYLRAVARWPELLRYFTDDLEEGARRRPGNRLQGLLFYSLILKALHRAILESRPHVIVATQHYPNIFTAKLKKQGKLTIPLVAIPAGFRLSPFWAQREVDRYLVATEEMGEGLCEQGVPPERIRVSGIPVDPEFSLPKDRKELRRKLGLHPELPVVLAMGGGEGIGLDGVVGPLMQEGHPTYQLVVIAGRNRELYQRVQALRGASPRPVRVLGFTEGIDEWMRAADLLVTKPGGLTVAEALAAGLPMIFHTSLGGQEEFHKEYVVRHGAGITLNQEAPLPHAVCHLLGEKDRLARMAELARRLGRPRSAWEAGEEISLLAKGTAG
ncbi:MAG: glycosyltransferase [Candidatus Binatia bacterium]